MVHHGKKRKTGTRFNDDSYRLRRKEERINIEFLSEQQENDDSHLGNCLQQSGGVAQLVRAVES